MPHHPALSRFKELCLALPEATVEPFGSHFTFRVRKKVFAYYTDNHHGDGRVAALLKAAPGMQQTLVGAAPEVFFVPPYVGPKGWMGIRLDLRKVDWKGVSSSVRESYRLTAPKTALAQLDRTAPRAERPASKCSR